MQSTISEALTSAGIDHTREYRLSRRDRIDFLIGTVGIEVKIKGSRADVIRQLGRYAESQQITELILACSMRRLLYGVPNEILGVPVRKHLLQGGLS
ncbi:hypothetical protein [Nesterenkonia rhizosphaerae]|uniref:hypothetical protein n=1 Tax=Nesterenkonia rhizosphaerae TaxID=1348272 RepID=UPI0031EBD835